MAHESITQMMDRSWSDLLARNSDLQARCADDEGIALCVRMAFDCGFFHGHGYGYQHASQVALDTMERLI